MPKSARNNLNKIFIFPLMIGLAVIAFFLLLTFFGCNSLNCSINMISLNNYKVQEIYEDNQSVYRALLADKNDFIRVEVRNGVTDKQAIEYINSRMIQVLGLFDRAPAPYPGEISNEIICNEQYQPKQASMSAHNTTIQYLDSYLNSRWQPGACSEDQAINREYLVFFYCENQQKVYQMELITGRDKFNIDRYTQMIKSITCR